MTSAQPILSVVVPVYNTDSQILEECLLSVLNQNLDNFEVIAVNDGSTEKSVAPLLDKIKNRFGHFSAIEQRNSGGVAAINRGVKEATGKYLAIVDHDDIMAAGALRTLISAAEGDNTQMATGKIYRFPGEIEFWKELTPLFDVRARYNSPLEEPSILKNTHYYNWVFRRDLFDKSVGEVKDRIVADYEIMHRMLAKTVGISVVDAPVYWWRRTSESIVSTDEFFLDRLNVIVDVTRYLRASNVGERYMRAYFVSIHQRLTWYLEKYLSSENSDLTNLYASTLFNLFDQMELGASQTRNLINSLPLSHTNKQIFLCGVEPDLASTKTALLKFSTPRTSLRGYRKTSWKQNIIDRIFPRLPQPFVWISRLRGKGRPLALVKAEQKYQADRDTIMFESFLAKEYSGSPRAIYEYLLQHHPNMKFIWAYHGDAINIPGNPVIVRRDTEAYYDALASASKLVNNVVFPAWFYGNKKRYLQTWHGTPLKRLGFDIAVPGPETTGLYKFYHESKNWDGLISANQHSTEKFKTAFKFRRDVLEIGYPANDIFYQPEKYLTRRIEVRALLGIPDEQRVILYAPTWRDNKKVGDWQFKFSLTPNFNKLRDFGDNSLVLVRQHHLTAASNKPTGVNMKDVSNYYDVYDLMVAADVLVTDYSSISFDWCCSKKPVLFYTPDLEEYANQARGFYFDLENNAPGAVCGTESELLDALHSLNHSLGDIDEKYQAFYDQYCSVHDGSATKRSVDWLLAD